MSVRSRSIAAVTAQIAALWCSLWPGVRIGADIPADSTAPSAEATPSRRPPASSTINLPARARYSQLSAAPGSRPLGPCKSGEPDVIPLGAIAAVIADGRYREHESERAHC